MKKYSCIIFDLDGTLANTYPGIYNSYHYACERMGMESPTNTIVGEAIGAPLLEVFEQRFHLDKEDALIAVEHYRKYYASNGIYEANAYDGMADTLDYLKRNGYLLGVATLKKEEFAVKILEELNLAKYFDVIVGMNSGDNLTKAQMLDKVSMMLNVDKSTAILVGDSSYDAVGAAEAEMDFIAVTYGFGFKTTSDTNKYTTIAVADTAYDLINKISASF